MRNDRLDFFRDFFVSFFSGREAFGRMCEMTNEPEDVTIGFVTGVNILKKSIIFYIFFRCCAWIGAESDWTHP